LVGVTKFIWLFGFFLAFLHAKVISTKMTYHPFSKSFSFKKNIFWSVTFGDTAADKSLEKKRRGSQTGAEHGGHVTRPGNHQSDGPRAVPNGDHRSSLSRISEVSGCDL
jgi:hypothetical protein